MPSKFFLETYPLYRRFAEYKIPDTLYSISTPQINMYCENCSSNQTFMMRNSFNDGLASDASPLGMSLKARYACVHCYEVERNFFIKFDDDGKWIMKVGQYPAWEIKGDINLEKLLGDHASYYSKGLVCESQGYGIGAFSYYRRIVEEVIDNLLDEISELLNDSEKAQYEDALAKTKKTIVTQEKIDLVKDLLPPILRPENMNPLSALHSALSEGLHADSDESCLSKAETCREILLFLVNQVAATKAASKEFTKNMRKILDKKGTKKASK